MIQTAKLPTSNIQFRNLDHSEAIEKRIREHISKLNQHFGEINSCHVVVEMHHRHHQHGNHFHVLVDVNVPGHELLTYNQPDKNKLYSDVYVAIRDAFDAMDRKLIALAQRQHS